MRSPRFPSTPLATALLLVLTGVPASAASAAEPLPCVVLEGVNDRCPTWEASYDGPTGGHDMPYGAALSPDGRVMVTAGDSAGANDSFDGVVVAHDTATGARLWASRQDTSTAVEASDLLADVTVGPSGERTYAVGASCGTWKVGASCDVLVLAYDLGSGALRWSRRIDRSDQQLDAGFSVVAGADSEGSDVVYVLGRSLGDATDIDMLTMALDGATGDERWSRRYDGHGGFDGASSIAVGGAGDDTVVITGSSVGDEGVNELATVAYDSRTGARTWVARHPTGIGQSVPNRAIVAGGRVFVSGASATSGSLIPSYMALAYDLRSGAPLWNATYDAGSVDFATDVAATPSGDQVVVTGMSRNPNYDFATVAYNGATGAQQWVARHDGVARDGDAAWSIAYDPATATYVTAGSSFVTGPGYLVALVAYSASGAKRWSAVRPGPGLLHAATPVHVVTTGGRTLVAAQIGHPAGTNIDSTVLAYAAE